MGANGIYGLSGSGMDVESMVKAGMMAKQNKLDKMLQTYTKNEWKKEAYLDIYKKVEDFNLNKLTNYKLSSTTNARSATSSDSSITAQANADAAIGSHYITVTNTASNAYLVGTKSISISENQGSATKLSQYLSFSVNGKAVSLTTDNSYYDLISEVSKATGGEVKASFTANEAGNQGYLSFYQKNAGSGNQINIIANDNTTAGFFTSLGLRDRATGIVYDGNGTNPSGNAVTATGTSATVDIDGRTYTSSKNSIYADGVTYNIGAAKIGEQITVNVDQDREKIIENVKSFVDDYNELLDSIYDAYREAPNSSYKPLTDAQKEEMTEDQIKKWEEKAKSGMLYHDQTLRKVIDSVRNAVTSKVNEATGNYDSIYKLGISTTGLYGQLKLDESKLSQVLADDPDAVHSVFATPNTGDSKDETLGGVAVRLSAALSNSTKTISSVSGKDSSTNDDSTLNTLMRSMQTRISNFKKMMKTFEDNLYKKYDAMESALAGLGSQMNYLSSMMGNS